MNLRTFIVALIFAFTSSWFNQSFSQTDVDFNFKIERSFINKSLWLQPYRYADENLKPLSVKIIIRKASDKNEPLDLNQIYLLDESKNLRIRPNAVYYFRANRKIYFKSKPVNNNYNTFRETTLEGYKNFEAKTYKTNFFGIKKKKLKPSVQLLKKINMRSKKVTYHIDFPVYEGFTYGKLFYKDKPIGFAAVTTK